MSRKKKKERRRAPRAKAHIPLRIKREKRVIEAWTENISSSGAYCTLDRFVPINTELSVSLMLPGEEGRSESERVTCHGIVVRNEPAAKGEAPSGYGMAICFTDLSKSDRHRLSDYVIQQLPEETRKMVTKKKCTSESYDPGKVYLTRPESEGGVSVSSANFRVLGDEINISKNGICCRTDRQIPLFREIAVNFVLPSASKRGKKRVMDAVQCSAVVVGCRKIPRSDKYDMAAYFVGLTREQKNRLDECIKKML